MKPDAPRVTVGLPVYNGGKHIAGALDALLGQTFKDFEIVVSDNASTDNTGEVCAEYAQTEARIRYVRQPTTVDIVQNFRFVLEQASTEYFMWHAADDLAAPAYIETLVSCLDDNPDVAACATDVQYMDVDGSGPEEVLQCIRPTVPWAEARRIFFEFPPANVVFAIYGLYRTTAALKAGGPVLSTYKNIVHCCEIPHLARVATLGRIVALPGALKYYRRRPDSVWQTEIKGLNRLDHLMLEWTMRAKLARIVLESGFDGTEKLRLLAKLSTQAFPRYARHGFEIVSGQRARKARAQRRALQRD